MSAQLTRELAAAVDAELPRERRAQAAAEIVRAVRAYRWVGIYDVGDDEISLIGQSGVPAQEEAVRSQSTVAGRSRTVVPILGAESGIVIGTLDAEGDRADAFSDEEVAFLEDCAAVLRPLYD
ncbi:MAG TPA: hypothetical protein VFF63_05550 [Candidatus Babeliales bacterium]|nr:hypothetical protein [Candidatus Babeliales bacterium]